MAGLSQPHERGPEIAADVGHIWTGRSLPSAECTQTSIRVKALLLSFKERDPGLHQNLIVSPPHLLWGNLTNKQV